MPPYRTVHSRKPLYATPDAPQSALASELAALRGALFGDQIHQPGALPRLEGMLDALSERVDSLAQTLREQREAQRLARLRWRWVLMGAAAAGALAGGGVWGLIERLVALG